MIFIGENCGYEMDYDEDETAILECDECGADMIAMPEEE